MYIEKNKDKKPQAKRISSRPATLARLKKSCWIRPPTINPAICRPVVIKCARTGGIRRPIELGMYNPPTQKALGRLRSTLFDGLCMDGQPAEAFLARKSPGSTPLRRKRARTSAKEDLYEEPPKKKRSRNPRRIPRAVAKSNGSARASGEVPQPKAPGPGYCHNCKKARDSCIVCPNVRTHRFCTNCVSRHFAEDYEIIFNKGIDCWVQRDGCPVCFWQCPCAACKRRMQNKKNKASVHAKAREFDEYEENYSEDLEEQEEGEEVTENAEDTYEVAAEAEEMEEPEEENEEVEEYPKAAASARPFDEEDDDLFTIVEGGIEGNVEEQDSEQEDDTLHDPKNEDSSEYNIEGHTHSEEDRHEHEYEIVGYAAQKKNLQSKKRRFMDEVERQSETVVEWAPQLCENDALEEGAEEEEDGENAEVEEEEMEDVKDTGRHLNWTPVRIMARRQRGGEKEYFVMWKDRWLTGDDTVSMYSRGELKEILKKRKRKRHPIEYLVRRKFSWENEAKVPQRLLDIWSTLYQEAVLNEKGKGKGKGEGWDLMWQNEQRKRQATPATTNRVDSE